MKGEITFDLVMEDDMDFVEGCYRLGDGIWHVFVFRKSDGAEKPNVMKDLVWKSDVTGIHAIAPHEEKLNKSKVLQTLSETLDVVL
jgi:hypothetical protein